MWWWIPRVPARGRLRQADLWAWGQPCLQTSRTARALQRNPFSEKNKDYRLMSSRTIPEGRERSSHSFCLFFVFIFILLLLNNQLCQCSQLLYFPQASYWVSHSLNCTSFPPATRLPLLIISNSTVATENSQVSYRELLLTYAIK